MLFESLLVALGVELTCDRFHICRMLGGGGVGALRFGRVVSGSLGITELKGLFDTLVLDSTLDLTFSRNWFDVVVGFAGVFLVWLADNGLDLFRWLLIREG